MRKQRTQKKPDLMKDVVVSVKFNGSLVEAIDREAESEGLSRSAIIRRVLIRNYAEAESIAVNS